VLFDFARVHGLAWEAVMYTGEAADEIAWLRLVPRGEEGVESGAAQLVRALEDLSRRRGEEVTGGEGSLSSTELRLAARFLACVDWDAALTWLGDRWWTDGDAMARSALLEAAARGRVEPRLATAEGVRRLLADARELSGSSWPVRTQRQLLAAAFARLPRFGSNGDDLGATFVEGWQADPLSVWLLRLSGLAGTGLADPATLEFARAVLASSEGARVGEAAYVALDILAGAKPGPAVTIGNPSALLALLPDKAEPDELARRFALARIVPPVDPERAAALSPAVLRMLVVNRILAGDFDAAAELLSAPSAGGGLGFGEPGSWARSCEPGRSTRRLEELARGLGELLRSGELMALTSVFKEAGRRAAAGNTERADPSDLSAATLGADLAALPRLELFVGAMDPAHQAVLCAELEEHGEASPIASDPAALGILAAAPVSGAGVARERLLVLFGLALTSPHANEGVDVLPAIEGSLATLWARNADAEAEAFILDVATVAAGHSEHPLAQEVLFRSWPPSPE
jgi:hypothetical protein